MKKNNYISALYCAGVVNADGVEFDEYFDMINKIGLGALTGAQMAKVALLMEAQKNYGFNECWKELKN